MSCTSQCLCPLSAHSERAAERTFTHALQQAVSCVTPAVLSNWRDRSQPDDHLCSLLLNNGHPVSLAGTLRLYLTVTLRYRIVTDTADRGRWAIRTEQYIYSLRNEETDVLAYHWHPGLGQRVTWPHLHIQDPALQDSVFLSSRKHLITGHVALEEVLLLAIEEFDVQPRLANWRQILEETRRAGAGA